MSERNGDALIRLTDSKSIFLAIGAQILLFIIALFYPDDIKLLLMIPMCIGWLSVIVSYLKHEHYAFKAISLAMAIELSFVFIVLNLPVGDT